MLDGLMVALLALILVAVLVLLLRKPPVDIRPDAAVSLQPLLERLERELRDELARQSQAGRNDLADFQRTSLAQSGDVARTQNEQIDSFRAQLAATQQQTEAGLRGFSETLAAQLMGLSEANERRLAEVRQTVDTRLQVQHEGNEKQLEQVRVQLAGLQQQTEAALRRFADSLAEQVQRLSEANERRLLEVRQAVDARLVALQEGNEKKLDQMRATVDEKLHATLEQRLGESFKQVADRLEQVHKGLGEMQSLARDVGSLNRVLTNVKTRGVFGEVQLAGLLEQVFTPDQYGVNVATLPNSSDRVEFAIKLPGQRDGAPLWLPIDAKFPREDYERLLEAHERADAPAVEAAAKALETRLRLEAKRIREKYVGPPHTTDFAFLFVPTEGLYAEALRRPGLVEGLQREHKVVLTGPTTLLATLGSLQMGFRTLALEKRSAEVWDVLGAVKTEFGKFGDVLAKTKKKLEEASNTIEAAEVRTRAMARQLKTVEALPEARVMQLLPGDAGAEDAPGA